MVVIYFLIMENTKFDYKKNFKNWAVNHHGQIIFGPNGIKWKQLNRMMKLGQAWIYHKAYCIKLGLAQTFWAIERPTIACYQYPLFPPMKSVGSSQNIQIFVDMGPEEKSNAHHWIRESNELQTGCFISSIILQQNWLYCTTTNSIIFSKLNEVLCCG